MLILAVNVMALPHIRAGAGAGEGAGAGSGAEAEAGAGAGILLLVASPPYFPLLYPEPAA